MAGRALHHRRLLVHRLYANPAVALARSITNTFSGIRPIDLPGFIVAELLGALLALALMGWLLRPGIIRQAQPQKAQS